MSARGGKKTAPNPCGCEKRRYLEYDDALVAALRATTKRKTPLRVYPCPKMNGFHLTSRTDRNTWSE